MPNLTHHLHPPKPQDWPSSIFARLIPSSCTGAPGLGCCKHQQLTPRTWPGPGTGLRGVSHAIGCCPTPANASVGSPVRAGPIPRSASPHRLCRGAHRRLAVCPDSQALRPMPGALISASRPSARRSMNCYIALLLTSRSSLVICVSKLTAAVGNTSSQWAAQRRNPTERRPSSLYSAESQVSCHPFKTSLDAPSTRHPCTPGCHISHPQAPS
jgi:hypothetical protein